MPKETIRIMFTRGDHATQPGGLILRRDIETGEYVSHAFTRIPHTRQPKDYFWGHYFHGYQALSRALADWEERILPYKRFEISEAELIAQGDVDYAA